MIIFLILGLVSSIFQLVILREFTFSIAKNELSLVVAVGWWLFFCSLGSLAALKSKPLGRAFLAFLFSLIFCLVISATHLVKLLAGLSYYEAASLGFVVLSALGLIGPLSFLIGYSFSVFSRSMVSAGRESEKLYARFFIYEALGFFLGGFIFTFLLSGYSNPFYFSFLPLLFLIVSERKKSAKLFSTLFITLLTIGFILIFSHILSREFKGSEITSFKNSGYGPLIVARQGEVESVYVNGSLVFSSEDKEWDETFIHTSFSAAHIKKVLFLGMVSPGQLKEILKHPIDSLDCVDINPLVLNWAKRNISEDSRVKFLVDDPYAYLRKDTGKYDCIIMNIPAPSSISLNRYFSYEFFQLIKKHLSPQGVFSFSIPSKRDILSPRILEFNSCIVNTLDAVFTSRLLMPSDTMIVIAADSKVTANDLMDNFTKQAVSKDYFTLYHLKDLLDAGQREYLESRLLREAGLNYNFNLRGFLYYLLLQQAKFYPNFFADIKKFSAYAFILLLAVIIGFIFSSLISKASRALANVSGLGFSAIGFTTALLILFQIFSGALFWKMGMITGLFMLGLSLGAYSAERAKEVIFSFKYAFAGYYFLFALFIASLLVITGYGQRLLYWDFSFYVYALCGGLFCGAIYPLSAKELSKNKSAKNNIAVSIYAADLWGAFLGTLAFSLFFIPFLGIAISLTALITILVFFSLKNIRV